MNHFLRHLTYAVVLAATVACSSPSSQKDTEEPVKLPTQEEVTTECEPNYRRTEWCGEEGNGKRVVTCVDGKFSYSECEIEPECVEDLIQACGLNGDGTRIRKCIDGQYDDVLSECDSTAECANGRLQEDYPCGENKTKTRECRDGMWQDITECLDTGIICEEGESFAVNCGYNNRGRAVRTCTNNEWVEGDCVDPDVCIDGMLLEERYCGINGRDIDQLVCVNGREEWSGCDEIDVCLDGAIESPGDGCAFGFDGNLQELCVSGQWEEQFCDYPTCSDLTVAAGQADSKPRVYGEFAVFLSNREENDIVSAYFTTIDGPNPVKIADLGDVQAVDIGRFYAAIITSGSVFRYDWRDGSVPEVFHNENASLEDVRVSENIALVSGRIDGEQRFIEIDLDDGRTTVRDVGGYDPTFDLHMGSFVYVVGGELYLHGASPQARAIRIAGNAANPHIRDDTIVFEPTDDGRISTIYRFHERPAPIEKDLTILHGLGPGYLIGQQEGEGNIVTFHDYRLQLTERFIIPVMELGSTEVHEFGLIAEDKLRGNIVYCDLEHFRIIGNEE